MTPVELDLAPQLAAHPRFRWMAGMLCEDGRRIISVDADGVRADDCYYDTTDAEWRGNPLTFPNLSDPGTCGCLLALLGEPFLDLSDQGDSVGENRPERRWVVRFFTGGEAPIYASSIATGASLGAALARALLASRDPA
jgi:hypothetical protein